jgi:2-hydroxychromene-2-carboxylate isomerase
MRFFFDFVSPYAYLGWHLARRLSAEHGRPLQPVPVLFAGLLSHHGTLGPAEVPAKRAYLIRDVHRKAERAKLPLVLPPAHPFNPLVALRAVCAIDDCEAQARMIDALYRATWGDGSGVEGEEAVRRVAESLGLDGARVVERARSDEAKSSLRRNTEDAIALGVFGVPTLFVDGEPFWGVDGIELAGDYLRGASRVPEELLERWATLPAGAERRR